MSQNDVKLEIIDLEKGLNILLNFHVIIFNSNQSTVLSLFFIFFSIKKENKDLDDFEALEEAAENMSLSSNSSFVTKLLGGRRSVNGIGSVSVKKGVIPNGGCLNNNNNKSLGTLKLKSPKITLWYWRSYFQWKSVFDNPPWDRKILLKYWTWKTFDKNFTLITLVT